MVVVSSHHSCVCNNDNNNIFIGSACIQHVLAHESMFISLNRHMGRLHIEKRQAQVIGNKWNDNGKAQYLLKINFTALFVLTMNRGFFKDEFLDDILNYNFWWPFSIRTLCCCYWGMRPLVACVTFIPRVLLGKKDAYLMSKGHT